jgi:hypothetical protein
VLGPARLGDPPDNLICIYSGGVRGTVSIARLAAQQPPIHLILHPVLAFLCSSVLPYTFIDVFFSFYSFSCLRPTMASSPSKRNEVELTEIPHRSTDRQDDLALARLGKKAVLKVSGIQRCIKLHELTQHLQRRFGFLSILGFSCTVLITWEGSLV